MAEIPPSSPAQYRSLRMHHRCAVLFCLAGILCMMAGLALAAHRFYHLRKMVTTNAKITAYEEGKGPDNKVVYLPLYEFAAQNGEVSFGNAAPTPTPPEHLIGSSVEVIYDPRSPETSSVKDFYALWGKALIPSIAGACVFSLFTLRLFQTRYRLNRLVPNTIED